MKNRFGLGTPVISIGIYAIILVVLFREFIFSNLMLFGTDTIEAGVMFRAFLAGYFKQHFTIPLWNPYLFGGLPFVDAMHGDTFFPLSFIQFVLPIYRALGWKLILAAFAGGIITYYYFRNLKFSPPICFFGGLLYLLNGFTISLVYAGHDGRMYVSILFPLLLMAVDMLFTKISVRSLFFWAISFSLLILANHPQLAYFAMWGVGAYIIYKLILLLRGGAGVKPVARISLFIILGLAVGLAGSIVQLLPQYIYVNKYSPRAEGGKGYDYSASWSNHPEEVISLVNPAFCGVNTGEVNNYWGRNAFKLNSDYAGFIPLIFALVALLYIRKSNIYFFGGLALLAILYGLGDHTPLFKLFYYLVPSVKSFRAPSTIMFLYVFSIVYLAVFGLRFICDSVKDKIQPMKIAKLLLYISLALTVFAILFAITPNGLLGIYNSIIYSDMDSSKAKIQAEASSTIGIGFWIIAIFSWLIWIFHRLLVKKSITVTVFILFISLLAVIDLWRDDAKFIETISYESIFKKDAVVDFIQHQGGKFRVFSFPQTFKNENYLAIYGIPEVFGYHGNQLKRYDQFTQREWLQSARTQQEFQQKYGQFLYGRKLDLLNVRYIASQFPLNDQKYKSVFNAGKTYLNENKAVLPRARVVYNYEINEDADSAMARINAVDFDYRNSVVLNKEPRISILGDSAGFTAAEAVKDNINDFEIEANIARAGVMVISDNYYPAWKATVDGHSEEILLADGNFMAIPVEAGDHIIKIRFDSPYYNYSSLLTKLTWVVYLGAVVYFLIRSRRKREIKNE